MLPVNTKPHNMKLSLLTRVIYYRYPTYTSFSMSRTSISSVEKKALYAMCFESKFKVHIIAFNHFLFHMTSHNSHKSCICFHYKIVLCLCGYCASSFDLFCKTTIAVVFKNSNNRTVPHSQFSLQCVKTQLC